MKKMIGLSLAILTVSSIFVGCQKQIADADSAAVAKRSPNKSTAQTCGTCTATWGETRETVAYNAYDLSLVAEHNATGITYLHLTRTAPGTFTKLSYTVTFTDVSAATTTTLLTQADPSGAGGGVSDRDLLKDKPGTTNLSIANFPADWASCDYITVTFSVIDGVGFGNSAPISVNYYLHSLCVVPACTAYQTETAYGGTTAGGGAAWWFAFDVAGPATQTIYAGQTIEVGTVTYTGTSFVIALTGGWELVPGAESVKVEGVSSVSGSRPIPGQSDLKGNSLTVDLTGYGPYPYYAIHLDVRKCTSTN